MTAKKPLPLYLLLLFGLAGGTTIGLATGQVYIYRLMNRPEVRVHFPSPRMLRKYPERDFSSRGRNV